MAPFNNMLYVVAREHYGVRRVFPDCNNSKLFASLTGKASFTQADIRNIRALGYDFMERIYRDGAMVATVSMTPPSM